MKKQIVSILCAAAVTCSAGAARVSDLSDVRPSDWYYDAVNHVFENGLMNGTSDTAFSPNATTSRGMIVTILYRLGLSVCGCRCSSVLWHAGLLGSYEFPCHWIQ